MTARQVTLNHPWHPGKRRKRVGPGVGSLWIRIALDLRGGQPQEDSE